jgi:nucleoside-diphosphate-sugar epimerase
MKILLTGGTGFIGRNLAVKLSKMGHHVLCLARDMSRADWMSNHPGLEPVQGDLENKESILPHLSDLDLVFHLAGLTKARNRDEFIRVNGLATGILVDAVLQGAKRIKKILYVSSLAVAGPHTSQDPAQENGKVAPITVYGEGKLLGEQLLLEKCRDIPWTIIRPPIVYGPYDRDVFVYFKMANSGLILLAVNRVLELSLIHVDDVTDGIILAGFSEESDGEIFYLSDGRVHTVEGVAATLAKIAGGAKIVHLPPSVAKLVGILGDCVTRVSGKPQVVNSQKVREALQDGWVCNIDKIKERLGFAPNIEAEVGFESTYSWYKNAGWL